MSSKFLVVYLYSTMTKAPAQAGLIISKNVGGSVIRHKVARQIRHSLRDHIEKFPPGAHVVVRALSGCAGKDLKKDLDSLVPKVLEKAMAKQ
jgi:ribonuclease P protein component